MSSLTNEQKEEIRRYVEEILAERQETPAGGFQFEEPPPQERVPKSRKLMVPSARIDGTVPEPLATWFHEERKRQGKTMSQFLVYLLYNCWRLMDSERGDGN